MSKNSSSRQTDHGLIICRCEGIRLEQIQASIRHSGVQTVNQLKKLTRAGMGPCQGRTCARIVENILAAEAGTPLGTEAFRSRPPVREVSMGALATGADQFEEPAGPVRVVMTRSPDQHASAPAEKKG
jgi:bacterioferritin-associated ferredoxin